MVHFYKDTPLMKNYWSTAEIEKLKTNYAAGKRIKIIAHELGRTPSAVNKTITRLGITRRFKKITIRRLTTLQYRTNSIQNKTAPAKVDKKNVTFATITKYLQSKGFNISKYHSPTNFNVFDINEEIFKVGNTPMTKMKVLLFANKIRLEEKQPIFSSKDITWY